MKSGDLYGEMFSDENMWYPLECFECKHWWMGRADVKCPKCGSDTSVGVAGCPEGYLAVGDEVEE